MFISYPKYSLFLLRRLKIPGAASLAYLLQNSWVMHYTEVLKYHRGIIQKAQQKNGKTCPSGLQIQTPNALGNLVIELSLSQNMCKEIAVRLWLVEQSLSGSQLESESFLRKCYVNVVNITKSSSLSNWGAIFIWESDCFSRSQFLLLLFSSLEWHKILTECLKYP